MQPTVIHREFGVTYHPDSLGRGPRAGGWTVQQPVERAMQRDAAGMAA